MDKFIDHRVFTIAAIVIAMIFWNFDSALHYFAYKEPTFDFIPDDFNELWMRLVIVVLIVLLGVYADRSARKQLIQEKQQVALNTYNSMIHATHHILNNLLNQMQLFEMEALKSTDFNPDIIRIIEGETASHRRLLTVDNRAMLVFSPEGYPVICRAIPPHKYYMSHITLVNISIHTIPYNHSITRINHVCRLLYPLERCRL